MIGLLNRNAGAVQAIAAMLTVVLALAALVGVKMQIDASERIQRSQSARDIYREFLNVSINKPEFSQPDSCALLAGRDAAAYDHYVDYLLFTAEQVLSSEPGWDEVFESALKPHAVSICQMQDDEGFTPQVAGLVTNFKSRHCAQVPACP